MDTKNHSSDRARAYPTGDAQGQHPAPVGNGQGLSHRNGRVRRKKRARSVRELKLRCASWNVGTMSGRGRELADVLKRRRINAACLQETKWKGARAREIGEGYKLFYCGSDGKKNGVGIVLDSRLKECVVDIKRANDRLIAIKLIVDGMTLNLVSVYAPQSGCEESVKEKFWEDFDCLLMNIQDSEEVYVGGDFNGHVGRENDGYERVHGGWGLGNRNADGETLLQAACAFDLAITNTWFKKKEEHLITYKSGHHATQIDYFLVRRRSLCCVKNCKVLPGEALVAQHRLVVMDVKLSVSPRNSQIRPPPKTRWRMLENDECASRFRNHIVEKIIEMNEMEEKLVDDCWNEMARHIRKVAKDVFGESKGKGLIDRDTWWWNLEVQNVLSEKKVAFKEWQVVKNVNTSLKDEKKEVYKEFKRRAKKAVAVARAKAQEKLYNSLDSPRGQKELYRITKERERRSRDITHIKCMKDEANVFKALQKQWQGHRKSFENAIVLALKDNYGYRGMNVYVRRAADSFRMAKGLFLTDNVVDVLLFDLSLTSIPHLNMPEVTFALASNVLKVEAGLSQMIVQSSYVLFRNQSDILSTVPQNPYEKSPFAYEQVDNTGMLAYLRNLKEYHQL
ncbi:uncharacterized protein LOC125068366 [Vanessa atalanta]|uniref:uncharacterized protein LOC125068366 n=1 Tax=Vanessa atalanta TaxID=42275 RepID=UPI001FCDCAE3|nr:uncharacterized protein LOC125068366 [Vanessa atalanta]